uniref:Uncharacterized protein n=1 Tax=Schistosoma curassoni TaxID=6186 RepID=A0A183JVR3_9TREM
MTGENNYTFCTKTSLLTIKIETPKPITARIDKAKINRRES